MMNTYDPKETKYPDWPSNKSWQSLNQWEEDMKPLKVPAGTGLFGSDISPPYAIDSAPHPEYIKKWRITNNETVKNTSIYFGLSEVQVLEACR